MEMEETEDYNQWRYWQVPSPCLIFENNALVEDTSDTQSEKVIPNFCELLLEFPELSNLPVVVSFGHRGARNSYCRHRIEATEIISMIKRKMEEVKYIANLFGMLASQEVEVGKEMRYDLLFSESSQAKQFCDKINDDSNIVWVNISPSDLGLEMVPVLNESELLHIEQDSVRSNVFATKVNVRMEEQEGQVEAHFSSVGDLNLFLFHHVTVNKNRTEMSFGSLSQNKYLKPVQILRPGDKKLYFLNSHKDVIKKTRDKYQFDQYSMNKKRNDGTYTFSFVSKLNMFKVLFGPEFCYLKSLSIDRNSKVVIVDVTNLRMVEKQYIEKDAENTVDKMELDRLRKEIEEKGIKIMEERKAREVLDNNLIKIKKEGEMLTDTLSFLKNSIKDTEILLGSFEESNKSSSTNYEVGYVRDSNDTEERGELEGRWEAEFDNFIEERGIKEIYKHCIVEHRKIHVNDNDDTRSVENYVLDEVQPLQNNAKFLSPKINNGQDDLPIAPVVEMFDSSVQLVLNMHESFDGRDAEPLILEEVENYNRASDERSDDKDKIGTDIHRELEFDLMLRPSVCTTSVSTSREDQELHEVVSAGDEVMAKWVVDNVWYRARIEEEVDEGYIVTFLDYGNIEWVPYYSVVLNYLDIIDKHEQVELVSR